MFHSIDCSFIMHRVAIWSMHDLTPLKPACWSCRFLTTCFYLINDYSVFKLSPTTESKILSRWFLTSLKFLVWKVQFDPFFPVQICLQFCHPDLSKEGLENSSCCSAFNASAGIKSIWTSMFTVFNIVMALVIFVAGLLCRSLKCFLILLSSIVYFVLSFFFSFAGFSD